MTARANPLRWTNEKPTKPGWYFYSLFGSRGHGDEVGCCYIDADFGWSDSWVPPGRGMEIPFYQTEWSGPVPAPHGVR